MHQRQEQTESGLPSRTNNKGDRNSFREKPEGGGAGDALVFLIPILAFIRLHVVGSLNGADVFVLVAFCYLLVCGRIRIGSRAGRQIMVLCSLWLVSQCVTDIVRHTAFKDYARGWSNIGFTIATLAVFFTLLCGRVKRLVIYGWGMVLGGVVGFLISPDKLMHDEPWKFGLSGPFTMGMLLVASQKRYHGYWPAILTAAAGMINVLLGARSLGGICVTAALYLLVLRVMRKRVAAGVKLKTGQVVAISALCAVGVIGILFAYGYAASKGFLGAGAREKYHLQSGGKYGVLLGGRVESLGSLPAIYASPILGHGSWARDPLYVFMEVRGLARLGYDVKDEFDPDELKEGYIPTHSYLLGAWVDAGILGAVFWFWVFVLCARAIFRVYPASAPLLPLVAYSGISMLWSILFSPYGAGARIGTVYSFVLLITAMSMAPPSLPRIIPGGRKKPRSAAAAARTAAM